MTMACKITKWDAKIFEKYMAYKEFSAVSSENLVMKLFKTTSITVASKTGGEGLRHLIQHVTSPAFTTHMCMNSSKIQNVTVLPATLPALPLLAIGQESKREYIAYGEYQGAHPYLYQTQTLRHITTDMYELEYQTHTYVSHWIAGTADCDNA
jgi:hypothetical protein